MISIIENPDGDIVFRSVAKFRAIVINIGKWSDRLKCIIPEEDGGVKLVQIWSRMDGWPKSGLSGNLVGRDILGKLFSACIAFRKIFCRKMSWSFWQINIKIFKRFTTSEYVTGQNLCDKSGEFLFYYMFTVGPIDNWYNVWGV